MYNKINLESENAKQLFKDDESFSNVLKLLYFYKKDLDLL